MQQRSTLAVALAAALACWRVATAIQPESCPITSALPKISRTQCAALAPYCSLHYLGPGCTSKQGAMLDGACQPANQCGFCCETACTVARRTVDEQCFWTGKQCVRCYENGPLDNGGPVVNSAMAAPAWRTDGIGNLVQIVCAWKFTSGLTFYFADTDPNGVAPATVSLRVLVFEHSTGIVVVDWTGPCTVSSLGWTGLKYYQATCEFSAGAMRVPLCEYPQLPPGWYDVLLSQFSSETYAFLMTQPSTACTYQGSCTYTQSMQPRVSTRTYLCNQGVAYRSLAFRLLGARTKKQLKPLLGC